MAANRSDFALFVSKLQQAGTAVKTTRYDASLLKYHKNVYCIYPTQSVISELCFFICIPRCISTRNMFTFFITHCKQLAFIRLAEDDIAMKKMSINDGVTFLVS